MAKEKFPSQIKYEKENPAITFRMKKEEKKKIIQFAEKSGKSVSELVREALLGLEKDFSEVYNETRIKNYNHGFQDAKRTYRIWNFCAICGEAIDILPNTNVHNIIIKYLKEKGWGHQECVI